MHNHRASVPIMPSLGQLLLFGSNVTCSREKQAASYRAETSNSPNKAPTQRQKMLQEINASLVRKFENAAMVGKGPVFTEPAELSQGNFNKMNLRLHVNVNHKAQFEVKKQLPKLYTEALHKSHSKKVNKLKEEFVMESMLNHSNDDRKSQQSHQSRIFRSSLKDIAMRNERNYRGTYSVKSFTLKNEGINDVSSRVPIALIPTKRESLNTSTVESVIMNRQGIPLDNPHVEVKTQRFPKNKLKVIHKRSHSTQGDIIEGLYQLKLLIERQSEIQKGGKKAQNKKEQNDFLQNEQLIPWERKSLYTSFRQQVIENTTLNTQETEEAPLERKNEVVVKNFSRIEEGRPLETSQDDLLIDGNEPENQEEEKEEEEEFVPYKKSPTNVNVESQSGHASQRSTIRENLTKTVGKLGMTFDAKPYYASLGRKIAGLHKIKATMTKFRSQSTQKWISKEYELKANLPDNNENNKERASYAKLLRSINAEDQEGRNGSDCLDSSADLRRTMEEGFRKTELESSRMMTEGNLRPEILKLYKAKSREQRVSMDFGDKAKVTKSRDFHRSNRSHDNFGGESFDQKGVQVVQVVQGKNGNPALYGRFLKIKKGYDRVKELLADEEGFVVGNKENNNNL